MGEYYFKDNKIDESCDVRTEVAQVRNSAVEFKLKKNQKIIRMISMKEYKNFLSKPEGKLRLGVVNHNILGKK